MFAIEATSALLWNLLNFQEPIPEQAVEPGLADPKVDFMIYLQILFNLL